MSEAELLVVEDAFQISGRGLLVVPDFAHAAGSWRGGSTTAKVIRPDGTPLVARLSFHVAHFNIPDPSVPHTCRWRIVPTFPDLAKEDVPIGSRVFVPAAIVEAIVGGTTTIE